MKRWVQPSVLFALAVLCAAELLLRLFLPQSVSGRFEYGYNPTSGFHETSDGTVSLVRAGGRRFRPQSFAKTPLPDTFRIMVIGDSVARGPALEDAYPRQIEERLRAAGIKAESFNLGVPGYGAQRKLIVLKKALEYKPDLVILHVNDSNEYEDEREYARSQEFKGWHPRNWMMKSFVLRRIYEAKTEQLFWKLLPVIIRNQKAVSDIDAKIAAAGSKEQLQAWAERVRKYTMESVSLTQADAVPIVLIIQAYCPKDKGVSLLDDHNVEELLIQAKGTGTLFLSMKELLEPLDFRKLYYADGSHLKPDGHKIIAKAVASLIQRNDMIQRKHSKIVQ